MAVQAWRVLAELEQPAADGPDFAKGEALAAMVRDLGLPDTIINQMRLAVSIALHRVVERDNRGSVRLTVSAHRAADTRSGMHGSWGFFLVEKPPDETQLGRIELFLFQEAS